MFVMLRCHKVSGVVIKYHRLYQFGNYDYIDTIKSIK